MTNPVTEKPEQEEGFTLIELMVVVLIMGILMAIAIPTFLGAKNSANAKAAESNVRNAVTAEASFYTDNSTYGTAISEPGIVLNAPTSWASPSTASNNVVTIEPVTAPSTTVLLGSKAADGNCYWAYISSGQVAYKYDGTCSATATGSTAIGTPTFPVTVTSSRGGAGAWAQGW